MTARPLSRLKLLIPAIAAAVLAGACSGNAGRTLPDSPNWSLADNPPVALGGSGAQSQTAPKDGPAYDYRGGRDPVTGKVSGPQPSGSTAGHRLVEIKKGDTLHGLSLTHHVSVKALMEANALTSTTIVPGKKLVIPQS